MNNRTVLTYIFTILLAVVVISCTSVESRADINTDVANPTAPKKIPVSKKETVKTEPVKKVEAPMVVADAGTTTDNTKKKTASKEKTKKQNIDVNRFNRLLKKGGEVHLSPLEDGIHDPKNRAASLLQNPKEALFGFPEARAGNQVDWVKALDSGKIKPRNAHDGKKVPPIIMDLNIVMEVKGSMPNVVFPHRPHTAILDCANCHPAIFTPLSGSNKMTMAENLMGQKCGVCHGKVAFPLSKCSTCHSGKK